VDPDNRRRVDYETRRQLLAPLKGCPTSDVLGPTSDVRGRQASDVQRSRTCDSIVSDPISPDVLLELFEHRADGRIKLFLMNRALGARAGLGELYERGGYVALQTSGTRRDQVFAFARRGGAGMAITCVPRLVASLSANGTPPIGSDVWADTRVHLPK